MSMRNFKIIIIVLFFTKTVVLAQDVKDDNPSFLPESGKYIVSGWVKENHPEQVVSYNSSILYEFKQGNMVISTTTLYTSGSIIDGWQRVIGIITIPSFQFDESIIDENYTLELKLQCNNLSSGDCFFDDIRFHPYNGSMKSFVYDEDTQRLMAELDENNYATFYEYDLEGGLIRVKKETERGVFTIQETRSNNPKKDE